MYLFIYIFLNAFWVNLTPFEILTSQLTKRQSPHPSCVIENKYVCAVVRSCIRERWSFSSWSILSHSENAPLPCLGSASVLVQEKVPFHFYESVLVSGDWSGVTLGTEAGHLQGKELRYVAFIGLWKGEGYRGESWCKGSLHQVRQYSSEVCSWIRGIFTTTCILRLQSGTYSEMGKEAEYPPVWATCKVRLKLIV